ncbi:MAG TPA: flagellar basal-body rod protein FlgG [bacterium]|nr:flagellar basal-body rod protein FlgG [bacterium]
MMRSLYTAASGMKTQQLQTDNIAHNLSNVSTTGFKKSRIEFQDLFYQTLQEAGTPITQGASIPVPLQIGLGVRPVAEQKMFTQGNLVQTDHQYDIAIEGEGFFQIRLPNGEIGYSRDGAFKIDKDGSVVTANGYYLEPPITVPQEALQFNVTEDGAVTVTLPNQIEPQEIGQITLVRFINPAGLNRMGNNLYLETAASGPPIEGQPLLDGFGAVQQLFLEQSNVQMVDEMVNLIVAQRAYEVNSKAIQTSDDMLGVANNLKR